MSDHGLPITAREFSDLVLRIETAEQTAHLQGLHATAQALNRAKNSAGWEMAGLLDKRTAETTPADAGEQHE